MRTPRRGKVHDRQHVGRAKRAALFGRSEKERFSGRRSLIDTIERLFYSSRIMHPAYRDEPCRTALNRVTGMSFRWSLNPYMGCAHRCTFCFVRAFERVAERPSDDRFEDRRSVRLAPDPAMAIPIGAQVPAPGQLVMRFPS